MTTAAPAITTASLSRPRGLLVLGVPLALGVLGLAFLLMAVATIEATSHRGDNCGKAIGSATDAAEAGADQRSVAAQVVAAVRAFPATADKPRAAVVALATAQQESGIRNLDYGDRDSLGVFQQRPSQGWGSPAQVTNVAHATTTFLEHLVRIPGWQARRVTDVAADVQRPAAAYRGLYERWVPLAMSLTHRFWDGAVAAALTSGVTRECSSVLVWSHASGATYPVPGRYRSADEHNWGGRGAHWHSWHTGTDFAAPCGTPVLAATAGQVEVDTSQAWAGRWLVKIVTGTHSVATWYGHMERLLVASGGQVQAGQQIGRVGALGNATGCHLHFEVHTRNGNIYGPDNVDPSAWLAREVS